MTARIFAKDMMEPAYAKINLALHVRRRLPIGYHDIETIFTFLDCGDNIIVSKGEGITLSIKGPFGDRLSATDNLVTDAARLLAEHSDIEHSVAITLDKRLPVASGIGGGSADAAATLRILNRYWKLGLSTAKLAEISALLGADVPACVLSRTSLGKGIGHDLVTIENGPLEGLNVLLVNPLVEISTAQVFSQWDGVDRGGLSDDAALKIADLGRNDLQKPAENILPVIGKIVAAMNDTDTLLAGMSGSGATCFALYKTIEYASHASQKIQNDFPGFWTMTGKLR